MIVVYGCAGLAVFLFVLLFFVGAGSRAAQEDSSNALFDSRSGALCPPEIVGRIFSPEDTNFVREMNSPSLCRMYSKERSRVARHWIRQTSAAIRGIKRDHLRSARSSQNLALAGEASLFASYIQLRCVCGLLLLSTFLVGPGTLQQVALYASKLSYRLKSVQQEADLTVRSLLPEGERG